MDAVAAVEDGLGELLNVLPDPPQSWLERLSRTEWSTLEEIRVREGRPLTLYGDGPPAFLGPDGLHPDPGGLPVWGRGAIEALVDLLAGRSLYAREAELAEGYLALPGGHRVGLAGRAVLQGSRVTTSRDWTGVNIRIARVLAGIADPLMERVAPPGAAPSSVLIVGPPRSGKTSLLRAALRDLSQRGWRLVVVDERGELARTAVQVLHADVLEGWPKPAGILTAVRVLGPEVVVVDEIGETADGEALRRARRSGVHVWATSHGGQGDVRRHPLTRNLVGSGVFDWVAELDGATTHRILEVWRAS